MRILVLGVNYAPEKTSVGPLTTGLCEHLATRGHAVTVVTAFPYYPEWRVWGGYRGRICQRERINNVNVLRVRHYVPARASSLPQRLAHDFSFTSGAFLAGLLAGKFDVIYCICPPPTLALSAYVLAKIHRRSYVIKLTDLGSDAALATGILRDGFALRLARAIESFVYHKADSVICLCQGFLDKLTARGIAPEKLRLIPDWADTQRVFPIPNAAAFRRAIGLSKEQFLAAHTGNMGKKQGLMNVVRAAKLCRDERHLVWLLIGHGEERAAIEKEIRQCGLGNVRLLPLQPAEGLAEMYSAADVLLLNQKAAVRDAVIPSKLLTYMAAGRAVVAAVNDQSEAARLLCRSKCGLIVPPENPEALAAAILSLRQDPALREKLAANGRAYAEEHFTKQKVLQEYEMFFSRYGGAEKARPEVCKEVSAAR